MTLPPVDCYADPDRELRGVRSKVASIRELALSVERKRDEGDSFDYADADEVFAKVNPHLASRGLVVASGVIGDPTLTMGQTKVLALVRVQIRLIDVDADHDDVGLVCEWAAEAWLDPESGAGAIAAAITGALKGWYVHTFAVRLVTRERASGKVYPVAGAKVSTAQIERFIGQAQKEAGLSGEQVLALANDLCDTAIDGLAMLPAAAADDLVDLIKTVGARERAKAREAAGAVS